MGDAPLLKDYFTVDAVQNLGDRVHQQHRGFDSDAFVATVFAQGWSELTFTARSQRMADALWRCLDMTQSQALDVLVGILPEPLEGADGALNGGYWLWPLGDFVATYTRDEPEKALDACYELTRRFTAEFAIRPYVAEHQELTVARLREWVQDPCEHVRRLVSEGTRPRLPWAGRISLPLDVVLPLLTELRADSSLYVRRSVANHLNDLCKEDPDRIIELLAEWHGEGGTDVRWVVRHALRNQLKAGEPRVMELYGYRPGVVDVSGLSVSPSTICVGESVECVFELVNGSDAPQDVMADVVVGFVKADGRVAPKVFKFKSVTLGAGESVECVKKLVFKQLSTRRLYPGEHSVLVRVNGVDCEPVFFDLE